MWPIKFDLVCWRCWAPQWNGVNRQRHGDCAPVKAFPHCPSDSVFYKYYMSHCAMWPNTNLDFNLARLYDLPQFCRHILWLVCEATWTDYVICDVGFINCDIGHVNWAYIKHGVERTTSCCYVDDWQTLLLLLLWPCAPCNEKLSSLTEEPRHNMETL